MKLETSEEKLACELGACRNPAGYKLTFAGLGRESDLHLCAKCVRELAEVTSRGGKGNGRK